MLKFKPFLLSLTLTAFLLSASSLRGQEREDTRERMEAFFGRINAFTQVYPQEKAYLHFDNNAYFLGDTLWFAAYVVPAGDFGRDCLSRVLYVELMSPEGAVLETKKLLIEYNRCHGEFVLDSLYYSGYFEVRAYTRYMLNFGEDAVFSRVFPVYEKVPDGQYERKSIKTRDTDRRRKKIQVRYASSVYNRFYDLLARKKDSRYYYEPLKKPKRDEVLVELSEIAPDELEESLLESLAEGSSEGEESTAYITNLEILSDHDSLLYYRKEARQPLSIEFFPEGGNLVEGLRQNVAFVVRDREGKGVNLTGSVMDKAGRTVADITPLYRGMGVFTLEPVQDRLSAVFSYREKTYRFELPRPRSQGVSLCVNTLPKERVVVSLYRTDSLQGQTLAIAVSHGGTVDFFEAVEDTPAQISLPRNELPEGVSRLTVFQRDGQVLAERLLFRRPEASPSLRLQGLDKKPLSPYQPTDLVFTALPEDCQGFSLSIRDEEQLDYTYTSEDIVSCLLLSSELKGYVPDLAHYVEKDDNLHRLHTNLLLLTHGWRRYDWSRMQPDFDTNQWEQPIEKGLMMDGVVYHRRKLLHPMLVDADLMFSFTVDSTEYYGPVRTNAQGRYALQLPAYYGWGEAVLGLTDARDRKEHSITLNRWFSPSPKRLSYYEINMPIEEAAQAASYSTQNDSLRNILLPEAGITRRSLRRRVNMNYSVQHYSVREELAYMHDMLRWWPETYFRDQPQYLLWSIMLRYNLPPCLFNVVLTEHYTSDTEVQEGTLNWMIPFTSRRHLPYMKELVIRTDSASLEAYHCLRRDGETDFFPSDGTYDVSYQFPYGYRMPEYTQSDYPDAIVYLIEDTAANRTALPHLGEGYVRHNLQGFSLSKEFYSPDYSGLTLPELPADYRRTLYWNPDVRLGEDGTARIRFFNSQRCRFLSVSAEGLSPQGIPFVWQP